MNIHDKAFLRQEMIKKRSSLTPQEVDEKTSSIVRRFLQLNQYAAAGSLLVYLPCKKEVNTIPIIRNAWELRKKVLVPVCQPARQLLVSELKNFQALKTSSFGIPEPQKEYLYPVSPDVIDLAVIPGVAFDLRGYRLGYGAGYFDRFLPSLRADCLKIGLAYEFQVVKELPVEKHDVKIDLLLTEHNTYFFSGIPNRS